MNRYKLMRFERGLSIQQVADGAGLTYPTVARIEQGAKITAPTAKRIADFYGMTVAQFLGIETKDAA